jgi:hypothetical protein
MTDKRDKRRAALASTDTPAPPGAPTTPAEAHREPPPEPLECAECHAQIPADQALVPEGLEYVLYFCSPGCHEAWEQARSAQGPDVEDAAGTGAPGSPRRDAD